MAMFSTGLWAAASTTSDGKYATGTVDFSAIGTLSANTTYWHNGIKFFSGNSANVSANTSSWSETVSIPAYISEKTASNQANKGKWGSNGTGKQYTMSGFACSQHTIGVHVNQPCTLTVVVNKNLASDTDDAGISASIDATAYATAWTTSTYKVAGDALTVASTRADATNAPGRYTLTIVVKNSDLTDGEAVVKMFNGSSGTGAGKLFCWESITITEAASYTITYNANGGTGDPMASSTNIISTCTFTAPDGMEFKEWNTQSDGNGDSYAPGETATTNLDLYAIWQSHSQHNDATLSALSVAGCTLSPAFAPATTAYTIALPFYASMPAVGAVTATKNDSYAKTPVVSISGKVITVHCVAEDETTEKDYTITVNFAPVPTASSSINIEQNILDNTKKWNVASALTAANIVTDGQNGLDSINESKPYRNYAFWGLKLKKNDADILKVIVPAGKVLNIKIGSIGAAVNVLINGEAYTTIPADKDKINHFFHLDATANPREVIFHTTANETTTLQQVKIGEECDDFTLPALYTVTYNAGAGSCEKASDFVEFADDQITLPEATPATGYGFDGWYNAATEGTKVGDAGDKITLTKDSTLYAQYSLNDYTITCSPTENGKVEANKATAHYGDLVTLTVTADPGYKVTSVKYNDVVVEPVESVYSFTMPAAAVTVTAVFSLATGIENQESKIDNRKFIKDGQLFIEKNGHVYNVFGTCIK